MTWFKWEYFSLYLTNLELDNNIKEEKLNDDFDEIDERFTAGLYVCSGQRKRYWKSIMKDKK